MRQLRLVGIDDEGTSLVLETPDGFEQFSLPKDERLRDLSRVEPPRIGTIVNETAPPLAPRDIQIRVRAGADPQALADETGVSLDRIMRFAYPVLQERTRVTDEARRGRTRRSEGQLVPFGELIDGRFSSHGIEPAVVVWDAYRRDDGGWTVTATFTADRKDGEDPKRLTAKFSFALMSRTVTALEEIAADLLSDRPVKALLPPPPPPVLETEAEQPPSPVRLAAVPDPTDIHLAEPSTGTPVRPPSRRQKAHTHPLPVALDDELFDQEAIDEPWHEPPLPLDLGQPVAELPAEPEVAEQHQLDDEGSHPRRRRAGEKPRMPSWDDILLGVRHKTD
jgi:hypothetical protein